LGSYLFCSLKVASDAFVLIALFTHSVRSAMRVSLLIVEAKAVSFGDRATKMKMKQKGTEADGRGIKWIAVTVTSV
jgi:hypothetical protein